MSCGRRRTSRSTGKYQGAPRHSRRVREISKRRPLATVSRGMLLRRRRSDDLSTVVDFAMNPPLPAFDSRLRAIVVGGTLPTAEIRS